MNRNIIDAEDLIIMKRYAANHINQRPQRQNQNIVIPMTICILIGIFLLLPTGIHAQCCSPGNPIGGTSALGVNDEHSWQIFLNYRYGYAGRYFEGNKPSTTQFIQDGQFNHMGGVVAYGLSKRLTLEGEFGYFINKTQRYVEGIIPSSQNGSGLTDLNLLLKLNLWRSELEEWEITTALGGKIPLGNNQQSDQGILLPRDLQPTTGAFDFIHSLFLYKGFLSRKFRTFLLTRTEIKGRSLDQYQYGHFFASSFFASYSAGLKWVLIGQIRGEIRGRDSRPVSGGGIPLPNNREQLIPTGSQKLFIIPQISYSLTPELQLSTLVELPLYQNYNDKQLSSTVAVMLSLGYRFGETQINTD